MKERIQSMKVAPGAYKAMLGLEQYLHESGLEASLLHLIKLRASQINGCALLPGHALEGSEGEGIGRPYSGCGDNQCLEPLGNFARQCRERITCRRKRCRRAPKVG